MSNIIKNEELLNSSIFNYGDLVFFIATIIVLMFLLILTLIILFNFFNKKINNNSSILVPLVYDKKNKRIRMMDAKFLQDAKSVFKNFEEITSGMWISEEKFINLFAKQDQQKLENNLENWKNNKLSLSLMYKQRKKEILKEYQFFFSNNQEQAIIVIYLNKYINFEADLSKKIGFFKELKIEDLNNLSKNKKKAVFINFSLKDQFWDVLKAQKMINNLLKNNKCLYFLIKKIYIFENVLILPIWGNTKFFLNFRKEKILKCFKKYKNDFFYQNISIVNEENVDNLSKIESLKRKIAFSLWKSTKNNNIFTFLNSQNISVFEYEDYISNLNELNKQIKNEILNFDKLPIYKENKTIFFIYKLNLKENIKNVTSEYKMKKLTDIFFWNYDRFIHEKNAFIYVNQNNFINFYKNQNKSFIPNLIVELKQIDKFQEQFLKNDLKIENFNWGVKIDYIDHKLLTFVKRTKPDFIFISKKIINHIQNVEVLLFLETLNNLSKNEKITLFYEENNLKLEEKWIKNISWHYFYSDK